MKFTEGNNKLEIIFDDEDEFDEKQYIRKEFDLLSVKADLYKKINDLYIKSEKE